MITGDLYVQYCTTCQVGKACFSPGCLETQWRVWKLNFNLTDFGSFRVRQIVEIKKRHSTEDRIVLLHRSELQQFWFQAVSARPGQRRACLVAIPTFCARGCLLQNTWKKALLVRFAVLHRWHRQQQLWTEAKQLENAVTCVNINLHGREERCF